MTLLRNKPAADDLASYNYALPPRLIAQRPPAKRDGGKLLLLPQMKIRPFAALPDQLKKGDLLVVNDSRVLPARLLGVKEGGGGRVEIFLERFVGRNAALAQARASKPLRVGQVVRAGGGAFVVEGREGRFYKFAAVNAQGKPCAAAPRFARAGQTPLPPYIRRPPAPQDARRYQTVFARAAGSVAAPTAGLHFSDALLRRVTAAGARIARITLHVGAGTFLPIQSAKIKDHEMHEERYSVSARAVAAVAAARLRGGRVLAVGTTVLRALEAAAIAGGGELRPVAAATRLFICPGFKFAVADGLLTNFHLPRSTLLLLVCAFGGREQTLAAYRHAAQKRMRFYSYGDAMLVWRQ